jgi:hypothetical protein
MSASSPAPVAGFTTSLPKRLVRNQPDSHFVGQKQKWFLLMMQGEESRVRVDHSRHPEFFPVALGELLASVEPRGGVQA